MNESKRQKIEGEEEEGEKEEGEYMFCPITVILVFPLFGPMEGRREETEGTGVINRGREEEEESRPFNERETKRGPIEGREEGIGQETEEGERKTAKTVTESFKRQERKGEGNKLNPWITIVSFPFKSREEGEREERTKRGNRENESPLNV